MSEIILRGEEQRKMAIAQISSLNLSKPFKITIEPYVKKRSREQLALYWKWVSIVAKETGHTKDEMDTFFKHTLLEPKVVEAYGHVFAVFSLNDQDVKQMSEYMTKVAAYAATDMGLFLPHPEDQLLEGGAK